MQPGFRSISKRSAMKALQKDPAARYASCQAFADDLRRFINDEPILARPVSRWSGVALVQAQSENCRPSAVASFFIVATAIIATWAWATTSAQAVVIAQERDTAERERDEAKRQRTIADEQRGIAVANEEKAKKKRKKPTVNARLQSAKGLASSRKNSLANSQSGLKTCSTSSPNRRLAQEAAWANDLRSPFWNRFQEMDELDVELTGGIRGEAIPTLRHCVRRSRSPCMKWISSKRRSGV